MKNGKILSIAFNSFILLLFHIFYFFCNTFPKHLLEFDSILSIGAIFLNVLFYVFYFAFLTSCVYQQSPFSGICFSVRKEEKFSQRGILNKIAILLVVQIIIDIVRISISSLIPTCDYLISDIMTLVSWFVIHCILHTKNAEPQSSLKTSLLVISAILGVGVCLCINITAMKECAELTEKFSPQHTSWNQASMNLDFEHGIRNLILDTFLGVLFLTASSKTTLFKLSTAFARIFLIMFVFVLTAILKVVVFPYNSLGKIQSQQGIGTSYSDTKIFTVHSSTTTVFRRTGYHSQEVCYSKTNHEVVYGNHENSSVVADYSLCDAEAYAGDSVKFQTLSYDFNNNHVVIHHNWAISYTVDDNPIVILYPEIKDQPKNDILIEVCKKMISDGNVVAFEYACEYLNQYDPEFLARYAERYAKQKFDNNELKYLDDYGYNKEYIVSIAQAINKA